MSFGHLFSHNFEMDSDGENDAKMMYKSGKFDPRVYSRTYYSKLDQEERFFLDCLHYFFNNKIVHGDEMLDLGTGPTMQTMISASAVVLKITLSDFVAENRVELNKWIKKEHDRIDFRFLYDYVAKLENKDADDLERRVRSKVSEVIHCDVTLPNPVAPLVAKYDIIVSSMCLEAAVTTRGQYVRAVFNMASLIKPGGYAVICGSFGCNEFTMGPHTFPTVNLTHEIAEEALTKAGLRPLFWMVLPRGTASADKPADFTHCYAVAAKKNDGP